MNRSQSLRIILALAILTLPTAPALAYIDPGAGSYIIQIVIGGALAGFYFISTSWKSITSKIRERFSPQSNDKK